MTVAGALWCPPAQSRIRHLDSDSGFSPSLVSRSVQRDTKLPATCFTITATLLSPGAGAAKNCSAEHGAIAPSSSDFVRLNSRMTKSVKLSGVMACAERLRSATRRTMLDLQTEGAPGRGVAQASALCSCAVYSGRSRISPRTILERRSSHVPLESNHDDECVAVLRVTRLVSPRTTASLQVARDAS